MISYNKLETVWIEATTTILANVDYCQNCVFSAGAIQRTFCGFGENLGSDSILFLTVLYHEPAHVHRDLYLTCVESQDVKMLTFIAGLCCVGFINMLVLLRNCTSNYRSVL